VKYAVFSSGSKQYLVSEGDEVLIEKINTEKGKPVEFDRVILTVQDEKVVVGKPYLKAKIKANVTEETKSKKIRVFKYKAKSRYRKKIGFRPSYSRIVIEKINS